MVNARIILSFSRTGLPEARERNATEDFDSRTHLAAVPVRAADAHGLDVERVHPPGPLAEPPPERAGGHP